MVGSYKALEASDPQRGDAASAFWHYLFQLATGLAIVASFIWVRLWAQDWRKPRPDLCPSCGYDLRATPDRCPECGVVPKVKGDMRRFLRWAFNFAAAVSALLCTAAFATWIHSYGRVDGITWADWGSRGEIPVLRTWSLIADNGRMSLIRQKFDSLSGAERLFYSRDELPSGFNYEGYRGLWPTDGRSFAFWREKWDGGSRDDARCPAWFIAALTAALPMIRVPWLVRLAKARARRKAGSCPICGYDLRATPDRCPECGTIAVTQGTPH